MKKIITIFTPTYNRAYLIERLYKSLTMQINKNFVWLVVDDGSIDNTKVLFDKWIKEDKISINYIYQENKGKMQAHNKGVLACETELFICVDSDDTLTDDAVQIIINKWLENPDKTMVCGILGRRKFINAQSHYFPKLDRISLYNLYNNGFRGDTSLVFKSKILKIHLFPIIFNEKFLTENYVYDQISAKGYEFLLIDRPLIICEYQSDGYTNNALALRKKYPMGFIEYQKQHIQLFYNKMKFKEQIRAKAILVSCLMFKHKNIYLIYKNMPNKSYFITSYILGLYLFIKINK